MGQAVMRIVNVGLVGCGRNSDNHLRVYRHTRSARLRAVCDIDIAKAREKAAKYHAEHAFSDLDSLLDLDLDLVDIVTPTPTHAELAIRALEAGANVLVEKPMAVSSKQCLRMIDAAKKSGRTLCVVHNKQFFDSVIRANTAIEHEGLTVTRVRLSHFFTHARLGFRPEWIMNEDSGGILWETLVHHFYLVERFMGPAESLYATSSRVKQAIDDAFTIVLRREGKTGVCEYEWDIKEPQITLQIITAEGDRFDADLSHDLMLRRSRRYRNRGVSALRSLEDDFTASTTKWLRHLRNFLEIRSYPGCLPYEKTFFLLIRQVLAHIAGELSAPPVTAKEGLRTIKLLEATKKSIEIQKAQPVD